MPSLNIAPAWSLLAAWSATPLRPIHTLVRTTEHRLRPPRIAVHEPQVRTACSAALAAGGSIDRLVTVRRERGSGPVPTIVFGGFVPDSAEQVFLLRRTLLRAGDVYCVSYPRAGFSLDLLCAQLTDLVAELAGRGAPPVLLGVSFGAGLIVEWLRRGRLAGAEPLLAGVVLVSPVACTGDIVAPGAAKPATLLGRALRPLLDAPAAGDTGVERARAVFTRMFEAGVQNKVALSLLMTRGELQRLRTAVLGTIRAISAAGAQERVAALRAMRAPTDYFSAALLPLTTAPTLVLFAENEEAVLDPASPTRFAFERAPRAYFPEGRVQVVRGRNPAAPVQHASLIFHVFEFLPPLQSFYQRVRLRALPLAA
jgi:alpha-beta hydrolase superfamily lysophospholipase